MEGMDGEDAAAATIGDAAGDDLCNDDCKDEEDNSTNASPADIRNSGSKDRRRCNSDSSAGDAPLNFEASAGDIPCCCSCCC